MNELDEPSRRVPRVLWQWIRDEAGDATAQHLDPLVSSVLASTTAGNADRAGDTPPEILEYWAQYLDSTRRLVHQNELQFIRHLRAAGWPDAEVRAWAVLDTDVDAHLAELHRLVRRIDRPPPPRRA